MWSCVLFVRPSKRRFMPKRKRPQVEEELVLELDFFAEEGW